MEYPENKAMIQHAAERFKNIYEMYLKDTDVQIFSSIAPLLVGGYQKVTLVDMRYINSAVIGKFIDFKMGFNGIYISMLKNKEKL